MAIHTAKRTIKLWAGLLVLLVCSLSSLAKNTVVVIPLGESPTTPSKTVFITTGTHTGNFGGPIGADAICQSEADAVGSKATGTYRAWLDTGIVAGLGNERSFNKSVDPYRRVDGQLVANDFTDLLNNQLKAPINVTAQGVTVATELVTVCTGVKADGSPFGPTCDGWANIEADGRVGNGRVGNGNAIGNEWTGDVDSIPCEASVHLYCFEQ